MEEPSLSAPSATRTILDHAANEPETPKLKDTEFDRELERVRRIAAYFDDRDPINAAIRRHPTRTVFIAAGVGFVIALLMRR
ncbi:MAG: DUF883 C-terminal domain-containing protein [Hyphomicrobium sp.]|uniref:DUF883 C-terminal domain-containing protein n=1 Tax=Hyphomicrobium sp. TaxID=82 RepID=UPI001321B769|nr:DUF883 C-terminal domain-containing protein [Hyphomicrobium sp.]KAB2939570.1 MAG: hypothetical protein F9K20_16245 [Hyphomicrobium sp.]MBZ0209269.1 DUF883 C-terminal domain-containing protein [Hyphomicrobium sp.]